MPRDSKNPPINRIINGDPTDAPTCWAVKTPVNGNTAIGNKDVTGIGMGSKIHHIMHSHATSAVTTIGWLCPAADSAQTRHRPESNPGQMVFLGSR